MENYRKRGAVLFSRYDLGNFAEWDGSADDVFTVEFTVTDYDVYNSAEATGYPAVVTDALDATPLRLVVDFINREHSFEGRINTCKFEFDKK